MKTASLMAISPSQEVYRDQDLGLSVIVTYECFVVALMKGECFLTTEMH